MERYNRMVDQVGATNGSLFEDSWPGSLIRNKIED